MLERTYRDIGDNHLVYREQQAIVEGQDHRLRHRAGFILGENLEI